MIDQGAGPVRLFISHHSSTYATALEVEELLARRGISCWVAPRDVEPGEPFDKAISRAIMGSAAILLLFCEKSDESRHVKRELILADSASRPIIPLRLEAISPRELAYHLADSQWIDWIDRRETVMDRVASQARQYAASTTAIDGPLPQTHRMPPIAAPQPRPRWPWIAGLAAAALALVAITWMLATRGATPGDGETAQEVQQTGEEVLAPASEAEAETVPLADQRETSAPAAAPAGDAPLPAPVTRPTATASPSPAPRQDSAEGSALQRVVDACRGAASDTEYLICADPSLESRAREMAAMVDAVRAALADQPAALRQFNVDQRGWFNGVRARCSTAACITRAQDERIPALRAILARQR